MDGPIEAAPTTDAAPRRIAIAVDGPGSSGKSSVGAAVARELGYRFCDTGLLYRAVTWLALDRGVAETDIERLVGLADEVQLRPDGNGSLAHVVVDGMDVTEAVRGPEVDGRVSGYARVPELRAALLARQRGLAADGGIVMAGRDIGTVVLPDADVKIYLDASLEERARRRAGERGYRGAGDPDGTRHAAILEQLRHRDAQDKGRAVAPLRPADDAIVLNTDGNEFGETVALVVAAIRDAAPDALGVGTGRAAS